MEYRRDIDGLRALAIVPVVMYHANFPLFSGGYIGVDIFFVISGFLITSIIYEEAAQGKFSIRNFYERRARRILPALFLMLLSTGLASSFFLWPSDLEDLSRSALSATLFYSNLYFWRDTDYFSPDAEFLPLLHTWSLSVEEQFYILWPFFILCCFYFPHKRGKFIGFVMIGILVSASLYAAGSKVTEDSKSAYYIIFYRFWELGIGGLFAIVMKEFPRSRDFFPSCTYLLGLVLIILSFIFLDKNSVFPGYNACWVVIGAALMIFSGGAKYNRLSFLIGLSPFVFIGKISYSFYLFHWPIFALYRNWSGEVDLTISESSLLIIFSLFISCISYYFVETPFRKKVRKRSVVRFSFSGAFIVLLICGTVIKLDGIPGRLVLPEYAASKVEMKSWECPGEKELRYGSEICIVGADWEEAETRLVLWGDSHAGHLAPLVVHAIDKKRTSLIISPSVGPFVDDNEVRYWYARDPEVSARMADFNSRFLESLNEDFKVDRILIAAAWSGYSDILYSKRGEDRGEVMAGQLLEFGTARMVGMIPNNISVKLVSDFPRPRREIISCVLENSSWVARKPLKICNGMQREWVDDWHQPSTNLLERMARKNENVGIVDLVDRFCSPSRCDVSIQGRILYSDDNHIRRNLSVEEREEMVKRLGLKDVLYGADRK